MISVCRTNCLQWMPRLRFCLLSHTLGAAPLRQSVEMKSDIAHCGTGSIWHHRLLGGLWGLSGFVVTGNVVLSSRWAEYQFWIACAVALSYVITGIGFIFGRTWARRTMTVLMVIAALLFLDMLLMFGFHGNRAGMWEMLLALGIVVYTLGFLLISAAWHSQDSV